MRSNLHYFAYGSNMNPARVAQRGLQVRDAVGETVTEEELARILAAGR